MREVETKQVSLQWMPKGSSDLRPMKAKRQHAEKKVMLTVFWDERGPVLVDFLPRGEVVNAERYVQLLGRLKESIRRRRPLLWKKDPTADDPKQRKFVIHHDNASSHTADISIAFFLHIPLLPHPPYSPDMAPCDYFLFPRLKAELAQMNIRNIPQLQQAVNQVLRNIPEEHYRGAIMQWPVRWMKCVAAGGNYFEGRHLAVDPDQYGLEFHSGGEESSDEADEDPEEA